MAVPEQHRVGEQLELSKIGLGTAPLGNMFAALPESDAITAIETALDRGVRYFDTAPLYGFGLAERRLGMAMRGIDREDVVVSTKAGRLLEVDRSPDYVAPEQWVNVPARKVVFDYSYDGFMKSFEQSLERMGLDDVDILYCHDIDMHTHGSVEARDARTAEFLGRKGGYKALESLRGSGAVKAIGIGVNEWEICERIARETDVDVFLLAGRYTLLEQSADDSFLPLCQEKGMKVVVGGPFNSGILATGPIAGAHFDYAPAAKSILNRVALIGAVCAAHGVSLKTAAIQFPLLHPAVASVIPGGATSAQIVENIDAGASDLPTALWRDLHSEGLVQLPGDFLGKP